MAVHLLDKLTTKRRLLLALVAGVAFSVGPGSVHAGDPYEYGDLGTQAYAAGNLPLAKSFIREALLLSQRSAPRWGEGDALGTKKQEWHELLVKIFWEKEQDGALLRHASRHLSAHAQRHWYCRVSERRGQFSTAQTCYEGVGDPGRVRRSILLQQMSETLNQ